MAPGGLVEMTSFPTKGILGNGGVCLVVIFIKFLDIARKSVYLPIIKKVQNKVPNVFLKINTWQTIPDYCKM